MCIGKHHLDGETQIDPTSFRNAKMSTKIITKMV
jgi:hypothetical protein